MRGWVPVMRCLLIDKIIAYEKGRKITGIKNVTMSENFLQDHFPGFPVMPGVLQLEAVSQLGSWLVFATTDFNKKAKVVSVKSLKFKEFVVPGDQVYEGMIIGEHNRENDLNVNACRTKKLSNMRAAGKDEAVILSPILPMTLEKAVQFIRQDELIEVTPLSIRLRKEELLLNRRKILDKKKTNI